MLTTTLQLQIRQLGVALATSARESVMLVVGRDMHWPLVVGSPLRPLASIISCTSQVQVLDHYAYHHENG